MPKKIILCTIYNYPPFETSIKYEHEIKQFGHLIKKLQASQPTLSIDEAYLLIRNHYSSINTYSIKEDED